MLMKNSKLSLFDKQRMRCLRLQGFRKLDKPNTIIDNDHKALAKVLQVRFETRAN